MIDPTTPKAEFVERVRKYFDDRVSGNKPLTIPGLAEHLTSTPEEILSYPEDGPFYDILAFAKLKCHNYLVDAMLSGRADKTTGQLILKNHFGYTDKMETKHTGRVNISKLLDEIEEANK